MSLTDGMMPNEIVVFEVGKPKLLRLSNPQKETRSLRDPQSSFSKLVPAITFDVLLEDNTPVKKKLSIIQKRLIAQLDPYLANGTLLTQDVRITKLGEGFTGAQWTVELIPRQT